MLWVVVLGLVLPSVFSQYIYNASELQPGSVRKCKNADGTFMKVGFDVKITYNPVNITVGTNYNVQAGVNAVSKKPYDEGVLQFMVALYKEPTDPFVNVTQNATCTDMLSLFGLKPNEKIHGLSFDCPFNPPTVIYPFLNFKKETPPKDHFYFPQGDYVFQVRLDQDPDVFMCIEGRIVVINSEMEFPDFDKLKNENYQTVDV